MSVEERIRSVVAGSGGRAPVERLAREALGLPAARGALARRLVESALVPLRGLALEGDEVVECARAPSEGRVVALALAPAPSPTALPALLAWSDVPAPAEPIDEIPLHGEDWRDRLEALGRALAGGRVVALSAGGARRVLRLASSLAGLEPDEEPEVVALAAVARALGLRIRSAEDAAGLVGEPVPDRPSRAARVLAELALHLADRGGVSPLELGELADAQLLPPFDFGERAFGREAVLALPEAPGVYLFEDAEGAVAYVGKSRNLRRRVSGYFQPRVEPRELRVREGAHALSHQRTGSELSALLREAELIRDLRPPLNVQAQTHARARASEAGLAACSRLAVIQPSALGGAEIVLLDRQRGCEVLQLVPSEPERSTLERRLLVALGDLAQRPEASSSALAQVEIALSWLAERGETASVLDASGPIEEVAVTLVRVASDPDLAEGRIVPR